MTSLSLSDAENRRHAAPPLISVERAAEPMALVMDTTPPDPNARLVRY
jgi:hypothetical protein